MKSSEVKVGQVYSAKVTNKVVPVRIEAENTNGGWDATNLTTNKPVRIKSAQRLRGAVDAPDAATANTDESKAKEPKKRSSATPATRSKKKAKSSTKATSPEKRDTDDRDAKGDETNDQPKRLSILDAAVKVLEERDAADGPLSCTQMIERMIAKGYWSPARGGLTPANTLYSAVLREINTKGASGESRFDKVERGKFSLSLKR